MKFALWLDSGKQGCDYTVACGQKLIELKAQTLEGAREEAKLAILDLTYVSVSEGANTPNNDSQTFKRALLLRVEEDFVDFAVAAQTQRVNEALAEQRESDRRKLAELRTKLGERGADDAG